MSALSKGPWEVFYVGSGDWDLVGPETQQDWMLAATAPDLLVALKEALSIITDYLDYEHNGDPWSEDARTMGEMDINDYERDGRLEAARALVAKATGSAP